MWETKCIISDRRTELMRVAWLPKSWASLKFLDPTLPWFRQMKAKNLGLRLLLSFARLLPRCLSLSRARALSLYLWLCLSVCLSVCLSQSLTLCLTFSLFRTHARTNITSSRKGVCACCICRKQKAFLKAFLQIQHVRFATR